jgi:hypothetical protein
MSASLPYVSESGPALAQKAADSFSVKLLRSDEVLLTGTCPKCEHLMSAYGEKHFMATMNAPQAILVTVLCSCEEEHPGRPDKKKGCGRYWNMIVNKAKQK